MAYAHTLFYGSGRLYVAAFGVNMKCCLTIGLCVWVTHPRKESLFTVKDNICTVRRILLDPFSGFAAYNAFSEKEAMIVIDIK